MCEKSGFLKHCVFRLSVGVVSVQIFLKYMTCHDSPGLLASIGNSYDITIGYACDCNLFTDYIMCTSDTIARIFIDCRTLHTKRLVCKFKQRTNVPCSGVRRIFIGGGFKSDIKNLVQCYKIESKSRRA